MQKIIFLFAYYLVGYANVLRVPSEYGTIQAAFNATLDGDTVLVSLGIYAEALTGPPHSFLLKGDTEIDTGDYPRPIINPSSLPNPTTLTDLIINASGTPVIENMVIKNDSRMFPRQFNSPPGGIINHSPNLILRRCIFDSTYLSVDSYNIAIALIEDCQFRNSLRFCIYTNRTINATDCDFSCHGTLPNVTCGTHSSFVRCRFRDNDHGELLEISGSDILIQDCIFGPYGPYGFPPIFAGIRNSLVENNLFTDCLVGQSVVQESCTCDSPVVFQNNHFLNNRNGPQYLGGLCISIGCGDGAVCRGAIFENNIFEDCSVRVGIKAIGLSASAELRHNRFVRMLPLTTETIHAGSQGIYARDNIFIQNGIAMVSSGVQVDATHNYWGDPSGPRHSSNPLGLGDSVSNHVLFNPWHTDTSFFDLSTDEPFLPHPSAFNLSVYPNPFNSSAKIKLEVPEPMIVKVELFDLLGRRVKEIYNAPVAHQKEISFQADNLASGVYFVRAKDTIWNRPLATQKMLLMK